MKDRDFYSNINIPLPNIDWQTVWGDSSPIGETTPRWKPIIDLNNIWPTEIHEKFKSIGLRLSMARVFKWHSRPFFPWHIDGNEKGTTKCALNWVVQGIGVIQWNDSMILDGHTNGLATAAAAGRFNDPYTCQTLPHEKQYLVDTSVPHRVVVGEEMKDRITVSILFRDNWLWPYYRTRDKLASVGLIAE